jgi:hypothetical protein
MVAIARVENAYSKKNRFTIPPRVWRSLCGHTSLKNKLCEATRTHPGQMQNLSEPKTCRVVLFLFFRSRKRLLEQFAPLV